MARHRGRHRRADLDDPRCTTAATGRSASPIATGSCATASRCRSTASTISTSGSGSPGRRASTPARASPTIPSTASSIAPGCCSSCRSPPCCSGAGGWAWVVWGVLVRVSACTTMHWFISYFAHTRGPSDWTVDGAVIQAHNVADHGDPDHGRELARQPSRLPELGAARPLSGPDRSRLSLHPVARAGGSRMECEAAVRPSAPARDHATDGARASRRRAARRRAVRRRQTCNVEPRRGAGPTAAAGTSPAAEPRAGPARSAR